MASKRTKSVIAENEPRRLTSWIEKFVDSTDGLEAPPQYRRWAAISALAGVLEQRVYVGNSAGRLYPNLYVFLVGPPGMGKTKSIATARNYLREVPEIHLAPTSMTMAALTDHLAEAKCSLIRHHDPDNRMEEYNSLYIGADELGAFVAEYKGNAIIPGLTALYDCEPYAASIRTNQLRVKIERPQLNIIAGTTPSNLLHFIPEYAWDQGFTSRLILVYAETQPLIDFFKTPATPVNGDLLHDLMIIRDTEGAFGWDDEFATHFHKWRELGEMPRPEHPKLEHYSSRRKSHLIKLSMIASVDRGKEQILRKTDFDTAYTWMCEAERHMPDIFQQGVGGTDSKALDEIIHEIKKLGVAHERKVINICRKYLPVTRIADAMKIMEGSGMIKVVAFDPKTQQKTFSVP